MLLIQRGLKRQRVRFKSVDVTRHEGHGFVRPENRLAFYGVAEKFLADTLGGRVEPLGDHLKNSSAQVLEGSV